MPTVSMRELSRHASAVVSNVANSHRPTLITRHGAPVVAVVPIDPESLEDMILSHAGSFFADYIAADEDLAAGRTRSAADVLAELD